MQKYGGTSGLNPQQNKVNDPFSSSGKQSKDSYASNYGNAYDNNYSHEVKTNTNNFNAQSKQQGGYNSKVQINVNNYNSKNQNVNQIQAEDDNRPIKQLTQ